MCITIVFETFSSSPFAFTYVPLNVIELSLLSIFSSIWSCLSADMFIDFTTLFPEFIWLNSILLFAESKFLIASAFSLLSAIRKFASAKSTEISFRYPASFTFNEIFNFVSVLSMSIDLECLSSS